VLVAALNGSREAGHWGSLLTQAAMARGIAGLIIDGAVRDVAEIADLRFPVFYRGLMPRKAEKTDPGQVREAVLMDGHTIVDRDFVVADADGVAIVPRARTDELNARVREIVEQERMIQERIREGADIGTAFGLSDRLRTDVAG
jgi:regulator of RNase E activity RraA